MEENANLRSPATASVGDTAPRALGVVAAGPSLPETFGGGLLDQKQGKGDVKARPEGPEVAQTVKEATGAHKREVGQEIASMMSQSFATDYDDGIIGAMAQKMTEEMSRASTWMQSQDEVREISPKERIYDLDLDADPRESADRLDHSSPPDSQSFSRSTETAGLTGVIYGIYDKLEQIANDRKDKDQPNAKADEKNVRDAQAVKPIITVPILRHALKNALSEGDIESIDVLYTQAELLGEKEAIPSDIYDLAGVIVGRLRDAHPKDDPLAKRNAHYLIYRDLLDHYLATGNMKQVRKFQRMLRNAQMDLKKAKLDASSDRKRDETKSPNKALPFQKEGNSSRRISNTADQSDSAAERVKRRSSSDEETKKRPPLASPERRLSCGLTGFEGRRVSTEKKRQRASYLKAGESLERIKEELEDMEQRKKEIEARIAHLRNQGSWSPTTPTGEDDGKSGVQCNKKCSMS